MRPAREVSSSDTDAKTIIDGGGDCALALKSNQDALHQAVIEYIDETIEDGFADVDLAAGQREQRQARPSIARWPRGRPAAVDRHISCANVSQHSPGSDSSR